MRTIEIRHSPAVVALAAIAAAFSLVVPPPLRAQSAPALEIVNPANSSVAIGSSFTVTVIARGQPITLQDAFFVVTDDDTSRDIGAAFSLEKKPLVIQKGDPATITIKMDSAALAQTISAQGNIILLYKASDASGTVASQQWSFKLLRPAPEVTVSGGPIDITRAVPFTAVSLVAADKEACLAYQSMPALLPLAANFTVQGEVFTANGDASHPQGASIQGVFYPDRVCFTTTIPGPYTELKARFHLVQPAVKKPVDFEVDFRLKDSLFWQFIATIISTLAALFLVSWTNTVRRRLLNQSDRDQVAGRLAQFLAANPNLGNHDSVVFVRQMILNSTFEDRTGDVDASSQTLASASTRLDQLVQSPPAASTLVAQSGQAIRILNPASCLITERKISFVIGEPNPAWPVGNGLYEWTVTGGAAGAHRIDGRKGVEVKRFECIFETSGSYDVTVTVNGANPESRSIDILSAPPPGFIAKYRLAETATVLITFLIAAGTAYALIQNAPTFGSVGDYIKLLAGAFGVSGGAGGAGTILSAVRGK